MFNLPSRSGRKFYFCLFVSRLEEGPLEIQLMIKSCQTAAYIKQMMTLGPKTLTHKVSSLHLHYSTGGISRFMVFIHL